MSLLVGLKVRELIWLHSRLEDMIVILNEANLMDPEVTHVTAKLLSTQAWVERVVRDASTLEGYIPPAKQPEETSLGS